MSGDLDDLCRTYVALMARRAHPGWLRRLTAESFVGDVLDDRAEARARTLERPLVGNAIGATPGRWGVLSGDNEFMSRVPWSASTSHCCITAQRETNAMTGT